MPEGTMSRLTLVDGLLMNLKHEIDPGRREYVAPELAHQRLVQLTGQDLGDDVDAWKLWFKRKKQAELGKEVDSSERLFG